MKYFKKGFTLIELLVVIAIIGILASVVLASLNTARSKAANATIKSDLSSARSQAQLFYDSQTPNSFSGLCGDPKIAQILTHSDNASGGTHFCYDTAGDTYVIASPLKIAEATSTWWCVDSDNNNTGEDAAVAGTPAACP